MIDLRKEARDRDCQIRLPGICCFDPATSVLAHLNGAGMGMKAPDIHASIACYMCHDAVDDRIKTRYSSDYLELSLHHGVIRTQNIWIAEGFIVVEDGKWILK